MYQYKQITDYGFFHIAYCMKNFVKLINDLFNNLIKIKLLMKSVVNLSLKISRN